MKVVNTIIFDRKGHNADVRVKHTADGKIHVVLSRAIEDGIMSDDRIFDEGQELLWSNMDMETVVITE